MVSQSLKACPTLLSEETLQQFVVMEMGEDFMEAKKAVGHKMAPEIISRVSAINLDVAANISELIVEHILDKLERCNRTLVCPCVCVSVCSLPCTTFLLSDEAEEGSCGEWGHSGAEGLTKLHFPSPGGGIPS